MTSREPPRQLDLFADILPTTKRGRKFKQPAEVVAFPLARHVTVRDMAKVMTRIPEDDRDPFWRKHTKNLIRERQIAGLSREAARADVLDYTAEVHRLTTYLDADPARSGRNGA